MEKIFLFGAGPQANIVIDIVEKEGKFSIAGIIDSKRDIGSIFNSYKIIGRQEDLAELSDKFNTNAGIISIGDNYLRFKLMNIILELNPNFQFVNAIHPSVIFGKKTKIGYGNVIMPGVIINTYAEIGNHCMMHTNASLEHNSVMNDFTSISAGVTTGGYLIIEEFSAIALGVTLFDRITIGKHSIVGSGSLVTKDIPAYSLAYGSPAKVIRKREIGEKYLK